MKKITLTLLLALFISNVYAQINTNILGCKLGVSSKATVERVLKSKGLNIEKSNATDLLEGVTFYDIKDGVSFGGIIWDDARIRFINGKFASIIFSKVASRETYNKLFASLKKKYARYLISADYPAPFFQDNNTEIIMMHGDKLSLSYVCRKFFDDEYNSQGSGEL